MGHPESNDPGDAKPDPARRPGQPGAERQQVDDTPTSDKPAPAGKFDDRQAQPGKSMERGAADHEVELRKAKKGGEEVIETAPPVSTVRTPPD